MTAATATVDRSLLALQAFELGQTKRVPWDIVGRLDDLIREGILVWVEEWARHGFALPLTQQRQVRFRDGRLVQETINAVTHAWTTLQQWLGTTLRHRRKARLIGGEVRQDVNVYDVIGLIEQLRAQPMLPFLETENVPEEPSYLQELDEPVPPAPRARPEKNDLSEAPQSVEQALPRPVAPPEPSRA